jgi:nucleoside-diphosphate-sugar epimerase
MTGSKNILIAGSTGMIGSQLLQICLDSPHVKNVLLLSRKPSSNKHSKIRELLVKDFLNIDALVSNFNEIDVVFFCIGVYTGTVDRDVFKKITVDYPVALGTAIQKKSPTCTFVLLSGAGADRSEKSRWMFAQYKGMAENKLHQIFNDRFYSARPSYIYPVTKRQEPNLMYTISRFVYPIIKLFGKKYSITSVELAKSMFVLGMKNQPKTTFENEELIDLASGVPELY